jgi:hypothetical protein
MVTVHPLDSCRMSLVHSICYPSQEVPFFPLAAGSIHLTGNHTEQALAVMHTG